MTKVFTTDELLTFMKSYTYAIFCTNDKEGPGLRVYAETKKFDLEEDEEGHWINYYGEANDSFNWTSMVWIPGDVFVFSYEEQGDFTGTKYVNGTLKSDKMDLVLRVHPKFCVKSNECRNRAKFICGRQRLAVCRLCLQHNAGGDGCQGRRSRSFDP